MSRASTRPAASAAVSAAESAAVGVTPIFGPVPGIAYVDVGLGIGVAAVRSRAGVCGQRRQQSGRAKTGDQKVPTAAPHFLDVAVRQLYLRVHQPSGGSAA